MKIDSRAWMGGWVAVVVATLFLNQEAAAQQPARPAAPQGTAAAPRGTAVALIDMRKVFEEYVAFKSQLTAIDSEIKQHEQALQEEQRKLVQQREQLTQLKEGSDERRRLEASLLQQLSQAKIQSELKRKDVMVKEAAVYHSAYQQVQRAVQAFANQRGIGLVLRYDSRPMDPSDRNSVLAGVNNAVIYQANLDITEAILGMLNQQASRPVQQR